MTNERKAGGRRARAGPVAESTDYGRLVIPDAKMRQGSGRWRKWRRDKVVTATDAGYILRLYPPWDDAPKSWAQHREPRPWTGTNEAMTHGTRCEPIARRNFSRDLEEEFQPACVEGLIDGWDFGASLDGYSDDGEVEAWVEIKSPYRGYDSRLWRMAIDDVVDPHYVPQLALQAMLMPEDADCFFHVYVSPWFDPYTGKQERQEGSITLQVDRLILEPYIEQLAHLIPLYASGADEPTPAEYPLITESR